MKAHTNISLKDRKTLQLSDFKGVDFSTSPLRVRNNRASNMRNFINEYGSNKKRNGWNEVLKFVENPVGEDNQNIRINGIFKFDESIIVYAGKKFYKVTNSGGVYQKTEIDLSQIDTERLISNRIQAFFNKGKAYIIGCGDYLVYGQWGDTQACELRRVADVAYIPTTTISINDDSVENDARATLDDVNCLSSKRINKLVGVSKKVWTLQTPIDANSSVTIDLEKQKSESETETITIANKVTDESNNTYSENLYIVSGDTKTVWGKIDFAKGKISVPYTIFSQGNYLSIEVTYNVNQSEKLDISSEWTWTLDASIDSDTKVEIILETLDLETEKLVSYVIENNLDNALYKVKKTEGQTVTTLNETCGSIDWGGKNENAKITLSCSTAPQIEGRDNIFVTFEHKTEGYEDRITKCTFGTLFGVEGNTDRLFLSGNSDYPNMDFHSEEDDYTYFSDLSSAALGSDAVAIKGYGRLSDSTLVVYKEENSQEAGIFYRTGHYETKYDSNGNATYIRGIFPHRAGTIGEGCVSTYACVNFAGDNLLLSSNGVFGIELANNVATAERYARERSRSINKSLLSHGELSEAVGIVYKNRYYLSIHSTENVCYVADSRYKYTAEDSLDNSYNYEWWIWDNIPARVWADIDGELYFGTSDGKICVFDDKYTDRTYLDFPAGSLGANIPESKFSYDEKLNLEENDKISFTAESALNSLYSLVDVDFKIEDGKIKTTKDKIQTLHYGTEVYADNVGNSGLMTDKKYYITDIDRANYTYALADNKDGNKINLNAGGFRICQCISNKELYITNVTNDGCFQLKAYKTGDALTLVSYKGETVSKPPAFVTCVDNVVAEWYTPVLDLGTNVYSKTLLKMTISTEPEVNGRLSFGYETRNVNKLIGAKGINVFSLENISFENFSFDTYFANSYTVKCNERNFNFIMFRFFSDDDCDCIVNNFTIVFKINKENRGVM